MHLKQNIILMYKWPYMRQTSNLFYVDKRINGVYYLFINDSKKTSQCRGHNSKFNHWILPIFGYDVENLFSHILTRAIEKISLGVKVIVF